FEELAQVIKRTADILDIKITDEGAQVIAKCSRGTPRIANRLVKRVSDFAIVKYDGVITEEVAIDSLKALKIDEYGLDSTDRALLKMIVEKYDGGPVGINTLAAALGEDIRTLEDVCEPYLLQIGLLQRTPQGRKISPQGYRHLGIKDFSAQRNLFED
ncbi:Holliday junction branch migration DNA helicase RuvB, partial [bacterium]|nr:Holliday junction branch migration DNA helicase RuvB [bacterium]